MRQVWHLPRMTQKTFCANHRRESGIRRWTRHLKQVNQLDAWERKGWETCRKRKSHCEVLRNLLTESAEFGWWTKSILKTNSVKMTEKRLEILKNSCDLPLYYQNVRKRMEMRKWLSIIADTCKNLFLNLNKIYASKNPFYTILYER